MKYALNLATDNRILSVTEEQYAAPGQPIVDSFPDGDVYDYLYIDGNYIYSPAPPVETLRYASNNYELGIIFEEDSLIFRAIQSIVRDEKLIIGQNCEELTISQIINEMEE